MSRIHCSLFARTVLFAFLLLFCALGNTTGALSAQSPAPAFAASSFFPALNAKGVCPDAPLRITFPTAPLTGIGKIQVFDASNDALAASIDISASTAIQSIGGAANYRYYPVVITGNADSRSFNRVPRRLTMIMTASPMHGRPRMGSTQKMQTMVRRIRGIVIAIRENT
jgi:hypothetical protein